MFCSTASSYLALLDLWSLSLWFDSIVLLGHGVMIGLTPSVRLCCCNSALPLAMHLKTILSGGAVHREQLQEQLIPDHKQNCLILVISIECSGHLLDLFHFCFCRCQSKFKHTCQWCMCVSLGTCHGFRKLCKRPGCT